MSNLLCVVLDFLDPSSQGDPDRRSRHHVFGMHAIKPGSLNDVPPPRRLIVVMGCKVAVRGDKPPKMLYIFGC